MSLQAPLYRPHLRSQSRERSFVTPRSTSYSNCFLIDENEKADNLKEQIPGNPPIALTTMKMGWEVDSLKEKNGSGKRQRKEEEEDDPRRRKYSPN